MHDDRKLASHHSGCGAPSENDRVAQLRLGFRAWLIAWALKRYPFISSRLRPCLFVGIPDGNQKIAWRDCSRESTPDGYKVVR